MAALSTTAVAMILTLAAVLCYVAFVLYGARLDGRRQTLREKGLHPETDSDGRVHAREEEEDHGSKRT